MSALRAVWPAPTAPAARQALRWLGGGLALMTAPAVAQSYDENPSGKIVYALADLRLTAADGETSWIDGGFGKGRFGGDRSGDVRVRPRLAEADLVVQPQLAWSLGATVAAVAQQGQEHSFDLSEAYLSYRHDPIGSLRLSARAGLFWPPVSLEHSGPAWGVTETITPSAINSWIGEEVKVIGVEASASTRLGAGRLSGTIGAFGFNDTAGTLLTFRGWALHDEKATAFGLQPLPPLNPFMQSAQAARTSPVIELDHRIGGYAKLGWSSDQLKLAAFYYDNRGDPEAVNASLQWGWRTRFLNLSAQLEPGAKTLISAQAMQGTTEMGFPLRGRIWIDTKFRSAFLLATRTIGEEGSLSGRVEAFGTRGRGSVEGPESSEDGWAVTLAGRRSFGDHVAVLGELLHIESRRAERALLGRSPRQHQSIAQLSLRLTL